MLGSRERERERERGTEVDFAEGSASDLAAELVLAGDDAFHVWIGMGYP